MRCPHCGKTVPKDDDDEENLITPIRTLVSLLREHDKYMVKSVKELHHIKMIMAMAFGLAVSLLLIGLAYIGGG